MALEGTADAGSGRPVEAVVVVAIHPAEEAGGRADPGKVRELVDRGDDERRESPVNGRDRN